MIPGSSALPPPRSVPTTVGRSSHRLEQAQAGGARANPRIPARKLGDFLLPQSIADPFALYQLVVADLIVLVVTCGVPALMFPAWSLLPIYIPVYAVLVTLFGFTEGLYKSAADPLPARIVPALARSALFAMALVFLAARDNMQPLATLAPFASSLLGLWLWRWLRQLASTRRCPRAESRNVLIVGGGRVASSIARTLRNDPLHLASVRGFVDDDLPLSPAILGRIKDLDWLTRAEFIDEVILALPGQPVRTRQAAEIALHNHLDIRAVPDLPAGLWPDAGIDRIGEVPVVTLHREPLPSAALSLKRVLDVTGALIALALASLMMAIIAVLIRFGSPGPVIYSAERIGAKGRRFPCYKFRSMVNDADQLKEKLRDLNQREGPIFKIDNDPRITRVGHVLRRYSLDELPQLWNVLRGDMSLVGPRPHPVDEVNHYELHQYRRLDVKPGMTGLWQITARNCPSFELGMHLDLTYIENWSLLLDLRILMGTFRVLFAPEGA